MLGQADGSSWIGCVLGPVDSSSCVLGPVDGSSRIGCVLGPVDGSSRIGCVLGPVDGSFCTDKPANNIQLRQ